MVCSPLGKTNIYVSGGVLQIRRRAAFGLAALPFVPALAFPDRSVVIVDGYPAGGGTDLVARRLGRELQRDWARPVIVENRSGANGTLAAIGVARASPDGHTLFMGNINTVVLAPLVLRGVDGAKAENFTPVSMVATQSHVVVVRQDAPIADIAGLVAAARARPGRVTYGSTGPGSVQHLAAALFAQRAGIEMQHIPYRGSAPALADLMAGTIDVIFEGVIPANPFLQSAQIRPLALAVTTPARVPALAVPTLEELGFGPMDMTSWWAILAPHGLPPGLRDAIAEAVQKALRQPEFVSFAKGLGVVRGEGLVGDALGEMMRGEAAKYQELIAAMGVRAE